MALALALGRRGQGNAWPNPAVGCVIVNDGRIVGRGCTQPGGRPHAETEALAQAGANARGATAYVSLEPCSHHGETPPCTDALIAAGVARVVSPLQDEDTRVSGRGFAALREAGIEVTTGVLADEAAQDHAGFFRAKGQGRPFVTLKLASSFDGRIAMVGAGTARADDPALTVRWPGAVRQPVRVVVSRRVDIPLLGQLARTAKTTPVWICHGSDADSERVRAWSGLGARMIRCGLTGTQVDAGDALEKLAEAGLTRILCEGGSALAASLLAGDFVDEVVGFTAGLAIGAEGLPSIGVLGLSRLDAAQRFDLVETRRIGPDALHRWRRRPPA